MPGGMRATQPCQRGGNVSVAVDEAAVVVAQSHEAAQLDVGRRGRPIPHGRDLARVHCHPRGRDPMAQEAQLRAAEGALRSLDVELLLPQDGEDLPDVAEMLL